jgi:flagellar basal body-associated protein FliL
MHFQVGTRWTSLVSFMLRLFRDQRESQLYSTKGRHRLDPALTGAIGTHTKGQDMQPNPDSTHRKGKH